MICARCQREIADYSSYCYFCGARQHSAIPRKRLMRSAADKKIAGVCAGFAEYFDIDPTIVRLIWVVVVFVPPICIAAVLGYIVAWIVMPVAPLPVTAPTEQTAKPS